MELDQILTLLSLAFLVVVLCFEWLPAGLVGLIAPLGLVLSGVIAPQTLWSSFGSSAVIAVAGMFVISAALTRTGALGFFGDLLIRLGGRGHGRMLFVMLVVIASISAFVANTTVVLIFIPIILHITNQLDQPPSRYMIPLSFGAIFGGMVTLIGTSTNVIVAQVGEKSWESLRAENPGLAPFELKMWDFTPMGLCFVAAGILYLVFLGRRFLPDRFVLHAVLGKGTRTEYVTEVEILSRSSLAGKTLAEVKVRYPGLRVLQILRGESIEPAQDDANLAAGDVLLVKGGFDHMVLLDSSAGVRVLPDLAPEDVATRPSAMALGEVIVPPTSRWIGKKFKDIGFHGRFGVSAIAVQRHGHHIREKVSELRVEPADMVLVQGPPENLSRLRLAENLILIEGDVKEAKRPRHAPLALAGLALFVGLFSLDLLDLETSAALAAVFLVLTRCLSLQEAFASLDWNVLFLLAGSLAIGSAVDEVGIDSMFAVFVRDVMGDASPAAIVALFFLLSGTLTDFLSNAATAALMVPLAAETAVRMELDPLPLFLSVAFAASSDFITPYGYQTNLLVYGPGGYRFRDFIAVGLPLKLLFLVMGSFLIPCFHPLRG